MSTNQVTTEVQKPQLSPSERFTGAVIKEFSSNNGQLDLTSFQRKLIQNYFIKVDQSLKDNEKKRLSQSEDKRDLLPFTWDNVNMAKLANDVISHSAVGLDPAQPNHINLIPFKNTMSNKYDFAFIMGYSGIELKSKKYGLSIPDDVVVELVYSTDKFKQIKKDLNNKIEGYIFEVVNDFDRGDIVGGFWYQVFHSEPQKNKLHVFSKADIEKRKPKYASAEFWGGEKNKWEGGKIVGKEKIDGWYAEMALKTIKRHCWNSIVIDSSKIDENYMNIISKEKDLSDTNIQNQINENANKHPIDFDEATIVEPAQLNAATVQETKEPVKEEEKKEEPKTSGAGF